MTTFLKLCQDVTRECGISGGTDLTPKPTTTVGQIGELNRVVNWVITAHKEIQNARSWRWMRKKFEFDTVADQDTYLFSAVTDVATSNAITRFKSWRLNDRRNPPKIFLKSAGETSQIFLSWVTWDNFEFLYHTGAIQAQSAQPIHITVSPDNEIVIGMSPNDVYTLRGDYYRSAQILTADDDVPELPEDYHDLIMYQAMEYYGLYESAVEIISRAQSGSVRLMNQLRRNQAEGFRKGSPLA